MPTALRVQIKQSLLLQKLLRCQALHNVANDIATFVGQKLGGNSDKLLNHVATEVKLRKARSQSGGQRFDTNRATAWGCPFYCHLASFE
ncbi:MAG: hypothetical protein ACI9HK_003981 [Pirellulaceae bacterium]|jgi:hypothetical protein